MSFRTGLAVVCLLLCTPTSGKGSLSNNDTPWNHEHIDVLPSEVRQYIANLCKGVPRVQHDFATYSPREKRWRINLEYLHCEGLGGYRRGNQCLDVDFVEVGPHFRLVSKHYAECGF